MNTNTNRNYVCKDEELPVISEFVANSLTRDSSAFSGYSPVFAAPYTEEYKARIAAVLELVQPASETVAHKVITERTNETLLGLFSPINHLEGYIELAGKKVPISTTDFGTVKLRKSSRTGDVESTMKQLRTVNSNITLYKAVLMEKGLTESLITKFSDAGISIAADKNESYRLISNRSAIVQNNRGQLNDLNDQMCEICRIGKILYKKTDRAKLNDYTFTFLLKQVRRVDKPDEQKPTDSPSAETTE